MKQIVNYIYERLHITSKIQYSCHPNDKYELKEIIFKRIEDEGPECDLNDIDVSNITDMSNLFSANVIFGDDIFKDFNGDVSLWNVSNVTNMGRMFDSCKNFNCDLSRWDVSNVKTMFAMFEKCKQFNCDLSKWDVSNVEKMVYMFEGCENFRQNLDDWDVSNVEEMSNTFKGCPTQPKWYDRKKWEEQ